MRPVRLCVIGDSLLDIDWEGEVRTVCRDAPAPVVEAPAEVVRPGGAALAAALAVGTGVAVTLVTALSRDAHGALLAGDLADRGVEVVDLGLDAPTPVKLRLRSAGQSLAHVDHGCIPVVGPGPWTAAADRAAATADAVLVADYGRGMAAQPPVLDGRCAAGRPLVWDPHARGPARRRPAAWSRPTWARPPDWSARALLAVPGARRRFPSWSRWPSSCPTTCGARSRSPPAGAGRYSPTGGRCRP